MKQHYHFNEKRRIMKRINLILTLFFSVLTLSCSKDYNIQNSELEISQEIKDLIYFKGDESSSIVIINTQGGPVPELLRTQFDITLENINTTNLLTVNVHQSQTLNPSLFTSNEITFDQAIDYDAESIETLYNVVKYFKDQGRTVYVLGISFGAFMTQELINKKGLNVADKYLIMVGRLDINEVFWKGYSEGKAGRFINGITPVLEEQTNITDKNMSKLAAGLGQNRYTELFNALDLSNITYVYGETDQAVGKLTDAEVQFLQSKGANIIAGNGNHSDTIEEYIVQGFKEAFGIE